MSKKMRFVVVGLILLIITGFISATVMPKIERWHLYESDHLVVSLPGGVKTVELVETLGDETGNPAIVLLTTRNNTIIKRDPSWFSDGQKRRWFAVRESGSIYFHAFYWMSPEHTLSEYIKEFQTVPAPMITDFEVSDHTNSINIFFERSAESKTFPIAHKTRISSSEQMQEYVQRATWSTKSVPEKEIWGVSFAEHALGNSTVTISSILMTEIGDYEIPSNAISIPYEISDPFNFIE